MFEDGDFEVVDECTGEDEAAETEAEAATKVESAGSKKTEQDGKTNGKAVPTPAKAPIHGILKMPKPATEAVVAPAESAPSAAAEKSNGDAVDFTADVCVEAEKEEPGDDDDGVIQIDVGDTVILDGEEPEAKAEAETETQSVEEVDVKAEGAEEAEVVTVPEEPLPPWYEEKLNGKMAIAKERMSKLARVLEFSYPAYKPWLEHFKDPVCHLDPPRRCSLTRPHTNRWKFICSRKPVQESTNKEEVSAEGTVNKKVETVWRLGPTDGSGVNTDNASQYPPFVMRVVKVFEEFIQNIELEGGSETIDTVKDEIVEPEAKTEDAKVPEVATETVETAETETDAAAVGESNADDVDGTDEKQPENDDTKDETSATGEKDTVIDRNHNWLWLLVRSNSKDELMVFATGKKISPSTMEKLKETFENGPGKDCNVKSLYCKSITKVGTTTSTNIKFLAGSEALEETVGGLKVQLAPKTNFWCNAAGVEQLGSAVWDLLNPVQKFTVAEVGCGLGLIGLMQAPKCRQIIGLDAPSEVEEAEMTSQLNEIKNASFVKGQPNDMMTQITKLLKNTRSAAIVNANTKIGRTIEMMTALRKISTLRRVVMITTLTKQSVRAILELTRPVDGDLGNPFMPVRAVLVDTLPVGPHFEVVIRMERLTMHKMTEPWFWNHVEFRAGLISQPQQQRGKRHERGGKQHKAQVAKAAAKATTTTGKPGGGVSPNSRVNRRSSYRANRRNKRKKQAQSRSAGQGVVVGARIVVGPGLVTGVVKSVPNLVKNPMAVSTPPKNLGKNPVGAKRAHSPDKTGTGSNPGTRKLPRNNRIPGKPGQPPKSSATDVSNAQSSNKMGGKTNKPKSASPLKKNPLARAPVRGSGTVGGQKRRRGWTTGDGPTMRGGHPMPPKRLRDNQNHGDDLRGRLSDGRMDPVLMRQVQEQQMLLSLAQQKLTNQSPVVDVDTAKQLHNMLNIVLEQTNKLQNQLPRSVWDRIAPIGNSGYDSPSQGGVDRDNNAGGFRERFVHDVGPQDMIITAQNREFMQQPAQQGPVPLFPGNRVPLESHQVAPSGMTPLEFGRGRPMPERSHAGGRDFRKSQDHDDNNWRRQNQFEKNRVAPQTMNKIIPSLTIPGEQMRAASPKRPLLSPPRLNVSGSRRFNEPSFGQPGGDMRRAQSPPRRLMSPPRRLMSPPRDQSGEIFHRRPSASQGGRQQQQQQTSSDARRGAMSPPRQREQNPVARSNSPFKKFGDDWSDRNAIEQPNWQSRQGGQLQQQQQQIQQRGSDRNALEKRWSNDRPSDSQEWDNGSPNERHRKNVDQDKRGDSGKEGMWIGGSGAAWNYKPSSMKPGNMDRGSMVGGGGMGKQWGGAVSGPSGGDNWNTRGKDGYGQSNSRMDGWRDSKKGDKEDWSDLPEDARDPWADDGGPSQNKQRWQSGGGSGGGGDRAATSNWGGRDGNDKMNQNWSNKPGFGSWPAKGPSMVGNKPQWSNIGNSNANEQRWTSQNDGPKKSLMSGNWQGTGNNQMDNWRPQNYSQGFSSQQQRPNLFGSGNYKDGR